MLRRERLGIIEWARHHSVSKDIGWIGRIAHLRRFIVLQVSIQPHFPTGTPNSSTNLF